MALVRRNTNTYTRIGQLGFNRSSDFPKTGGSSE
jgi:hypothetical protein